MRKEQTNPECMGVYKMAQSHQNFTAMNKDKQGLGETVPRFLKNEQTKIEKIELSKTILKPDRILITKQKLKGCLGG